MVSAVRSPVGVPIGARTAEEVALSVLAALTAEVRLEGLTPPKSNAPDAPAEAVDPICGMSVVVGDQTPHLHHDGHDYWYCNVGCRSRHVEDLAVGAGP